MALPSWAQKMREMFVGGVTSQFLLYGNVHDLVPLERSDKSVDYVSLRSFLEEVMFSPFEVVIFYDRGKGIRVRRGMNEFQKYLEIYDSFNQTNFATYPGQIPKDPKRALELIGRYIQVGLQRTHIDKGASDKDEAKTIPNPVKIAVVIDYAQYVVPRGDVLQLLGDSSEILIRVLDWGSDPAIMGANISTCLIAENLGDLNRLLVESPYNAKLKISMPDEKEILSFIECLTRELSSTEYAKLCKVPAPVLAQKLVGLTKVNVRALIMDGINNKKEITLQFLGKNKKEIIEKECNELLEFVESPYTLDMVAGHREAKKWLREDGFLLKEGKLRSIPMGYLFTGGIGTGKTFLANCWAGELGIPFVQFKNFRDKWQGATEGNLEKIFNVLDALGQVVVFIDEADQATGKRDTGSGDSGVSGRVYSMLAQKMSDTRNRGRIIWILATSRPDLLEVDLKRQGRLDVHIPLFAPQGKEERNELFEVIAKKVGIENMAGELPEIPDSLDIGGNEMESLLVRASRICDLQKVGEEKRSLPEIIQSILPDFRSSPHSRALEYMDLVAVKECTDSRFLPPKYRNLTIEEIDARTEELRRYVR